MNSDDTTAPALRDETTADCDTTPNDARCYNPAHRCCDCGAHTLATYNDARERTDHADCPSPSSNY